MAVESNQYAAQIAAVRSLAASRAEMIPLYDTKQFMMLIERERARADRAAASTVVTVRRKSKPAAPVKEIKPGEQPKPSSADVWGATTGNREFSLVLFRPRARADRSGMADLLISTVRTTDAVGVIDARRLGVLLPDTAAENAHLFVKKILTAAEEIGVSLSHEVHTYPKDWPSDLLPGWDDVDHHGEDGEGGGDHDAGHRHGNRKAKHTGHQRVLQHAAWREEPQSNLVRGLVNWLQAFAARRQQRRLARPQVQHA